MATFQCTAAPFYDETDVDAVTHSNRVESQWGPEYSGLGSQLTRVHAPQAAWHPDELVPAYALTAPKPLNGTSRGASQSLCMSGGDAAGVRPSVVVQTKLSGVWKALIVLALVLACIAVGIAAFALTRTGSCSCGSSASSGGGAAASSSASSDLLLNATAQRVWILASTVSSLNESITSQRAVLEGLSASTTPRFVALASAVDSLNATIADQQVSLANLSSVTVPHLNWLAGAVDSLNATIADQHVSLANLSSVTVPRLNRLAGAVDSLNATIVGQQATLASVRPTQVVSISPSNLSLCTGNWTTQSIPEPDFGLTLCRKVADSGCGSIFVAVPAGTVYSRVEGWVTLYQKGTPNAFGPNSFPTLGDSLTIWSGSTLLWDYAVGWGRRATGLTDLCPADGGTQPSALLNGFWSCATSNPTDIGSATAFFNVPVFGPSQAFSRSLPAATSAPIELRFCLNEPRSNEEIYLHSASISVRF
jgi:hypothetical protein